MANFADIFLRIRGETRDSEEKVGGLAGLVKAFGNLDETADVDVDTGEALADLVALRAFAKALTEEAIELDATAPNVATTRARLREIVQELKSVDIALDKTDQRIARFGRQGETALGRLTMAVLRMRRTDAAIRPEIENEGAVTAALYRMEAMLDAFANREVNVDVDVDRQGRGRAQMAALSRAAGAMGESLGNAGDAVRKVSISMGPFTAKLTSPIIVIAALVGSILVGLVGALGAMVVALVGAAGAVGLLAGGLLTSLTPAVALAAAAMARFGKITEAMKAQEAAKDSAARKAAEGTKAAAQAAEQRRAAELAVADALRSLGQAEEEVGNAVQTARQDIQQANRAQQEANQALKDSNEDLARTTAEAYRAIADSAERVTDALLAVEDARLGIDEASLGIREAEAALASLREESNATGPALGEVFKKFTDVDVDFDPAALIAGLERAGVKQQDQQLDIERAILRVRRAKLAEKQANDTLGDSERTLTDARAENLRFQREGINAYEPYTQAVRSQQDAVRALHEATMAANAANRTGIGGHAAVVAALRGVEDAERRLAEARRARTQAMSAASLMPDDAAKAQQLLAELTAAERAFLSVLTSVKAQMRGIFQPATDALFRGLTSAVAKAPQLMAPLQGAFVALGTAIGGAVNHVMGSLIQPDMIAKFDYITRGAAELARILMGPVFATFLRIMTNLAVAAMPYLIRGANLLAAAMLRWSTGFASVGGFQRILAFLMPMLGAVARFMGALARVGLAFFIAVAPLAARFLDVLTGMLNRVAAFLNTKEGQDRMKEWFGALFDFAEKMLPLFGQIMRFFMEVFTIIAPALGMFSSLFTFILRIINAVLSFLAPLLTIIAQIIMLFVGGAGILRAIGLVWKAIKFFGRLAGRIFTGFKRLISTVGGKVKAVFGGLFAILSDPFQKFWGWLKNLAGKMFDGGKMLIKGLIDGIASVGGAVGKIVMKLLGKAADLLPGSDPKDPRSPLRGLADKGRAILSTMAEGVPQGADELTTALHRQLVPVVGQIEATVASPKALPVGGAAGQGTVIQHQDVNVPPAPGYDGMGDANTQAAKLARELRRRGRGRGF